MSLLDKLWDDTLAGPQPESGLGRLRKPPSFTLRQNSGKELDGSEEGVKVTRSIMIRKPPGNLMVGNGSPPVSPAGSTPPVSPFSGNRESHRFWRRSTSDAYERRSGVDGVGPRCPPPPYDM